MVLPPQYKQLLGEQVVKRTRNRNIQRIDLLRLQPSESLVSLHCLSGGLHHSVVSRTRHLHMLIDFWHIQLAIPGARFRVSSHI